MKVSLKNLFEAGGGADAGKFELLKTPLDTARKYAESLGMDLDSELPNFDSNYKLAQSKAKLGKTQRKDMPVINDSDVRLLQQRLKAGALDINKPFAPDTEQSNPFPQGLSGKDAQSYLKRGFEDGEIPDDQIKYKIANVPVGKLKPIQKQIYYDKGIGGTAKNGVPATKSFLSKTFFITSSDNFIIDGHHRFLQGVLVDPSLPVQCLVIDLPISKLLPLTLAYGDAIGNTRNA